MTEYVEDFDKWVDDVLKTYKHEHNVFADSSITSGISICYDLDKGEAAFSSIEDNNEYNSTKGIAMAYAKLRRMDIPKEVKKCRVYDLKSGDKFLINHFNSDNKTVEDECYFLGNNPYCEGVSYYVFDKDPEYPRFLKNNTEVLKIIQY